MRRQRPRLKEPRRPQPLVDPNPLHAPLSPATHHRKKERFFPPPANYLKVEVPITPSPPKIAILGFGPPILSFARRCRQTGISLHLLDLREKARGRPRHCPSWLTTHSEAITWTEIGTPRALDKIRHVVESTHSSALISADELAQRWLSQNRYVFEPHCRILAPPTEVLEALLDKQVQVDLARQAGFQVLPTWYLTHPTCAAAIPARHFPLCVRPTFPNSVRPVFKAKVLSTRAQLIAWLESLQLTGYPLIAQPFRAGPNLLIHGVRPESGGPTPLLAYRTTRKFQGVAQSLEALDLTSTLTDACQNFVAASRLTGPFHFDLLHSTRDQQTYFLELNARMGGSTVKVLGLGHDEPLLTLKAFGIEPPQPSPLTAPRRRVTSKRSLVKQLVETLAAKQLCGLRYPQQGRLATFSNTLRELLSVADPALSLRDLEGSARYLFRYHSN